MRSTGGSSPGGTGSLSGSVRLLATTGSFSGTFKGSLSLDLSSILFLSSVFLSPRRESRSSRPRSRPLPRLSDLRLDLRPPSRSRLSLDLDLDELELELELLEDPDEDEELLLEDPDDDEELSLLLRSLSERPPAPDRSLLESLDDRPPSFLADLRFSGEESPLELDLDSRLDGMVNQILMNFGFKIQIFIQYS